MKTIHSHPYHGITYIDKGWGWTVQVKLLGQHRMLRAFASTAEQAARRHDIALSILECFSPPLARPNFPDDFRAIPFRPKAEDISEDEKNFRAEVLRWRDVLTEEVNAAGGDVVDLEIDRNRVRDAHQSQEDAKRILLGAKLVARTVTLREMFRSFEMDPNNAKEIDNCLDRVARLANANR
jgi:hypothetical protein